MNEFKPCGCGWVSDKTYVECADHAAMRKRLDKLEPEVVHSIRLGRYLSLQGLVRGYEKQIERTLAEMDSVWLTLTDDEIAWLDFRNIKSPGSESGSPYGDEIVDDGRYDREQ